MNFVQAFILSLVAWIGWGIIYSAGFKYVGDLYWYYGLPFSLILAGIYVFWYKARYSSEEVPKKR